jgi:hypothetical protein
MGKTGTEPIFGAAAFACPHCGAFANQRWLQLHASGGGNDPPLVLNAESARKDVAAEENLRPDAKAKILAEIDHIDRGHPIVTGRAEYVSVRPVYNLVLSRCFSCDDIAVWVHERVLYPKAQEGPPANEDMPGDVHEDYVEASRILSLSPRGACALLRLALQKLCVHLGGKGKKIDDDIATLVKAGLSPVIQQALDAIRVIGNEAVHPGTLDLRDDVPTATQLFGAINVVVEQMISHPKHIATLYQKLPPAKIAVIERRDKE